MDQRLSILRPTFTSSALLLAAAALSAQAAPQTSDCNGDGIPDFEQFGPNYAVWAPTSSNGSGAMTDQASWCPEAFTWQDLLIFEQSVDSGVGAVTFDSFWQAGSLWTIDGDWKLQSTNLASFYLGGDPNDDATLRVNGSLVLRGYGSVEGVVTVGFDYHGGSLDLEAGGLSATDEILVGVDSTATLFVRDAYLFGPSIRVGSSSVPTSSGSLIVLPTADIDVSSGLFVSGLATIDGTLEGVAFGPSSLGSRPAVIRGSGWMRKLESRLAVIQPTFVSNAVNGSVDGVLEVEEVFNMVEPMSGAAGSLLIAPMLWNGQVQVPSLLVGSATLGGVLRATFAAPELSYFQPTDIVVSATPINGAFEAIQGDGLPAGRTLRLMSSTDGKRLTLSTVQAPPPPEMDGGTQSSLLRVALDNAVADFNGDGLLDVAVLLEQDADGDSAVRFFKTSATGQSQAAQVDFPGDASHIAAFQSSTGSQPGVAVTLAEGSVLLLFNDGGWNFSTDLVQLSSSDDPRGIASGAFLGVAAGTRSQLAVGCAGSSQLRIIGEEAGGGYGVLWQTAVASPDLVRAGNLDNSGLDDIAVMQEGSPAFWTLTSIGGQVPATQWPLPANPVGLCLARLQGARDAVVCTLQSPDGVQEPGPANLAICKPGTAALLRPPALLSAGINASDITAGDFDSDGLVDLAVVTTLGGTESIGFLMNTTNPENAQSPLVFTPGGTMAGVYRPRIIKAADVDGDGKAEVATLSAGNPGGGSGGGGALGPDWDGGLGSNNGGGTCTAGDIDCDGEVDGADLALLLGNWGSCPGCAADIDGDGSVGGSDLALLLGNWG